MKNSVLLCKFKKLRYSTIKKQKYGGTWKAQIRPPNLKFSNSMRIFHLRACCSLTHDIHRLIRLYAIRLHYHLNQHVGLQRHMLTQRQLKQPPEQSSIELNLSYSYYRPKVSLTLLNTINKPIKIFDYKYSFAS